MKFKIPNYKKDKGFTLVELVVVMVVFIFIIGAATVIFVSIVQQQRRILSEQELLNQVSYVEEYMSKALRMARKDEIGDPASGGCLGDSGADCYLDSGCAGYNYALTRLDTSSGLYRGIKFINQSDNDACQEFYLDGTALKEIKNGAPAVALTSDDLKINYIKFVVEGAAGSSGVQPRVTISLDIQVKGSGDQPKEKIQTTVSQRNLNVVEP